MAKKIQGTQQILSSLEIAKLGNDETLDCFSAIFLILDNKYTIQKSNIRLAEIMNVNKDELVGKSIQILFKPEVWKEFLNYFESYSAHQFQLPLGPTAGMKSERLYHWALNNFRVNNSEGETYFSLVGQEIADFFESEKKLSVLLSSIPLGVLTIGVDGLIEAGYSRFCLHFFGITEIAGQSIEKLLFEPCYSSMSEEVLACIKTIVTSIGQDISKFRSSEYLLPPTLRLKPSMGGGYQIFIGIKYQPLTKNNIVEKLMLILEDCTEIEDLKLLEQESKAAEHSALARLLELKSSGNEVLSVVMEDVHTMFERFDEALANDAFNDILGLLHSIKGTVRMAKLNNLSKMAHDIESDFIAENLKTNKDIDKKNKMNREMLKSRLASFTAEWNEYYSIYRALFTKSSKTDAETSSDQSTNPQSRNESAILMLIRKHQKLQSLLLQPFQPLPSSDSGHSGNSGNEVTGAVKQIKLDAVTELSTKIQSERLDWAIHSFRTTPLRSIRETSTLLVKETADRLNKKVEVIFLGAAWDRVTINSQVKSVLNECLVHLLTNAISHGVENENDRITAGKTSIAKIKVTATESGSLLEVEVEDDGAGISVENIRRSALRKKIISLRESINLTPEQLIDIIFLPQFSTQNETNEFSGRGIGLYTVLEAVKSLDGTIRVDSVQPYGTKFRFSIKMSKELVIDRNCVLLEDWFVKLNQQLTIMSESRGFTITSIENFETALKEDEKHLLLADEFRLMCSVLTWIGSFAGNGTISIKFYRQNDELIHCRVVKSTTSIWTETEMEFSLSLAVSSYYLKEHGGKLSTTHNELEMSFGMLLDYNEVDIYEDQIVSALDYA